jgi:hypothetical protein
MSISLERVADLLQQFKEYGKGRIGYCEYIKKDGTLRPIQFRFDVKSYLKGGKLTYNPKDHGLMIVCDVRIAKENKLKGKQDSPYRSINLATIKKLALNGQKYEVEV